MDNYSTSLQLSQKMQNCISIYADMLGTPDPAKSDVYGFVPGLRMSVEAQVLEKQLDKLKEGIFQVLFTGGFDAGKSTMLNALMHKRILRTSINAETAVITKIIFGKEESVIVHMKDIDKDGNAKTIQMSVQDFFSEYRVDQDNADKFDSVDYVVLRQPGEGIAGKLVQFVDSPGTENSVADTQTARRFAKGASAIVHLINSAMPFVLEDKEYITSHYAKKQMRNIFFVCNRFDCLCKEEQEDLKLAARKQLKDVFTDENGRFDEELYQSRVFYTDSYHSLLYRIGESDEDDKKTGIPEFEDALGRYLTAEDRDKQAFRGYMPQLASEYVGAVNKIENILDSYRKGVEKLIMERDNFESKKESLETIISQIEESCKNCVVGIVSDAKNEYNSCMNRISTGWDDHFRNTAIRFGLKDMIGLAWNKKNDAKIREITQPFADAVQQYVKDELEQMGKALSKNMDARLEKLERQLSMQQEQMRCLDLPISINDLRQALLGGMDTCGDITVDNDNLDDANLFQIIMGIIGMDPEIVVGGINGKTSNGQAIMNFLVKNFFEFIAYYMVCWPVGIAMIVHRIRGMVKGMKSEKNSCAADILLGLKEDTVKALKEEQERYVMELENQLAAVTRAGVTMADSIRTQVDDYNASLNDTITRLESQSDNLETETERTGKIKALLLKNISEMNQMLNGAPLTDEDVRKLAV